jgi:hypothetical protein
MLFRFLSVGHTRAREAGFVAGLIVWTVFPETYLSDDRTTPCIEKE